MQTAPTEKTTLSVVLPCLNEQATLAQCITELRSALDASGLVACEIIVVDNGSADRSADIAREMGARLVAVAQRGYGRALSAGIKAATSPHVVFADADGTYPLSLAPDLYRRTVEAELSLGWRHGHAEKSSRARCPGCTGGWERRC